MLPSPKHRSLVLAAILFSSPVPADAIEIVVPNDLATAPGSTNNQFPLSAITIGLTMRYQQVYDASPFGAVLSPHRIMGIAFRADEYHGQPFTATIPDIEVRLSTTVHKPGALSDTFDENIGPDETVVHRGPLMLSHSVVGESGQLTPFDLLIPCQVPFVYDPNQGNLLLEIRNFDMRETVPFDATDLSTTATSRLFAVNANASIASMTGRNEGLVTQFILMPVPEPASLPLGITAIAAFLISARFQVAQRRR